ncbi:MAG: T9SS type A sorting domain-containing protein [Calditrichaeota bacterium]|nr:T9SS type A sorting domain-containing protein [Calditrichota bacterium]MCB9369491.1 T9SS type A sorting domain-containing protein [Calditrichota bacterium]
MLRRMFFTLVILLSTLSTAFSQITLTADDLPPMGTHYTYYEAYDVTFNPGDGGANRAWDVASYELAPTSDEYWIPPSETQFGSEFPSATLCIHEIDAEEQLFTYARIEHNGAFGLGIGVIEGDSSYTVHTESDVLLLPLPLMIGSEWTTLSVLEIEPEEGVVIQQRDSSVHEIDGWGMMATPFWDAQTLRDNFYETHKTYMNGSLIEYREEYSFSWISQTAGLEVQFTCTENCGPGFTVGDLSIVRNTTTAVDPSRGPLAEKLAVRQNYPNPFNPTTTLPVQLLKPGKLELTVFNELGQVVSHREFEFLAGDYSVPIDGSSWSSGAYFAQVRTGDAVQNIPMRLVK